MPDDTLVLLHIWQLWCCVFRLLNELTLPDMPIAFNPDDRPSADEDVGGGPFFGYCNVPKLTTNLPFPDLWSPEALSCGPGCTPFTASDQRQEQAVFLGRPTGMLVLLQMCICTCCYIGIGL